MGRTTPVQRTRAVGFGLGNPPFLRMSEVHHTSTTHAVSLCQGVPMEGSLCLFCIRGSTKRHALKSTMPPKTPCPQNRSILKKAVSSKTPRPQKHHAVKDTMPPKTPCPQKHHAAKDIVSPKTPRPQRHHAPKKAMPSKAPCRQRHHAVKDTMPSKTPRPKRHHAVKGKPSLDKL